MSDFENEDAGDSLGDLAAQLTDTVGLAEDAGANDAMPNHIADQVEEYSAHAEQRDSHLAEQEADQEDEQPAQSHKQRVPLAAMQEERRARQAAQEQVRVLQEQLAAHQAQMQQFQAWQQQLAAQQQQAQQQAEIPAFVDDPEGHVNALKAQFEQRLNDLQGEQQQRQQAEQFHAQTVDAVNYAAQAEAEFRASNPDYDAAFAHVQATAGQQIRQMYPQASEQELQMVEQAALLGFVQHCRANGLNPSEQVFAKARMLGFQPQRRAPRKAAPTSLGAIPGGSLGPDDHGRPSVKSIAAMSEAEFDRLWSQMEADSVQRPY